MCVVCPAGMSDIKGVEQHLSGNHHKLRIKVFTYNPIIMNDPISKLKFYSVAGLIFWCNLLWQRITQFLFVVESIIFGSKLVFSIEMWQEYNLDQALSQPPALTVTNLEALTSFIEGTYQSHSAAACGQLTVRRDVVEVLQGLVHDKFPGECVQVKYGNSCKYTNVVRNEKSHQACQLPLMCWHY